MKKSVLLVSLFVLSGILVGCDNTPNEEENHIKLEEASSVKEAIEAFKYETNYTMNILDYHYGDKNTIYVTENGYYDVFNSFGYIKDNENNVYKFDIDYNNELVANEVVEGIDSIYNNNLFTSFSDFDLDYIDSGLEVEITSNYNKNVFLNLIGTSTSLSEVSSFKVNYNVEELDLSFLMTFSDETTASLTISNRGSTSINVINQYVNNGGTYFVPDSKVVEFRTSFKGNNFTRNVYNDEKTALIGKEYFCNDYYIMNYFEAGYAAYSGGNIAIVDKAYKDDSGNVTNLENGSYLMTCSTNPEVEIIPYLAHTNFKETVMSEIYNYPSNLEMWDYLNLFEVSSYYNDYMTTFDAICILDAYNNFGIGNAGFTTVNLSALSYNYTNTVFTFYVYGTFDGTFGYFSFEFSDFGTTSHPGVEKFKEHLVEQI